MDLLLSLLPLLGCALIMAVCMGLMGLGHRHSGGDAQPQTADPEVAALREEVARLRAERAEDARRVDG